MLKMALLFSPLLFKIGLQANFPTPLAIGKGESAERVRLTSTTPP